MHYVGSGSRHQFLQPLANTAIEPGPGPISARQPYPQYGGPIPWDYNEGTGNYNALQIKLKQELAGGLYFLAAYTYGKSMDLASDPQADTITNFYNLAQDYGPSDYSRTQMFSFAASYALPVGNGKQFLTNANRSCRYSSRRLEHWRHLYRRLGTSLLRPGGRRRREHGWWDRKGRNGTPMLRAIPPRRESNGSIRTRFTVPTFPYTVW